MQTASFLSPSCVANLLILSALLTSCAEEPGTATAPKTSPSEKPAQPAQVEHATLTLGDQVWMAENMGIDLDGSYVYGDDAANAARYGRLYTWRAAMEACPEGYRLPTKSEFEELITHLGGHDLAIDLMLIGGSQGFGGMLGGSKSIKENYRNLGVRGTYWSSTRQDDEKAWYLSINARTEEVKMISGGKDAGFSCRCIQENEGEAGK